MRTRTAWSKWWVLAAVATAGTTVAGCESSTDDPRSGWTVAPSPVEGVGAASQPVTINWTTDFFDDFTGTSLNSANWQDQPEWVNNELQCYNNSYNENGQHKTLDVSNGTLKLRVVNSFTSSPCNTYDKFGNQHPSTQYYGARITTKNRQEFALGKWTANAKLYTWTTSGTVGQPSGLSGMFPAWWILGNRNNEIPVQRSDENVCWPLLGSGEIDIFEHSGSTGQNNFAARGIQNLGSCNNGNWQTYQVNLSSDLSSFHQYQVENTGSNLIYRIDGNWAGSNNGIGGNYPEPYFAILNYALQSNMAGGYKEYAMEVDWVKHESPSTTNCNGTVCCATSCVNSAGNFQCGGTGCGSLPGGANVCCTGTIQNLGFYCNGNLTQAPCIE
jgi:hypothetical protein